MVDQRENIMFERIRELGGSFYQAYLDAGYREWTSSFWAESKKTPYFMNKWIYGEDGIKLFGIHITWHDWTPYGDRCPQKVSAEYDVQLNTSDGKTFNAVLLSGDYSPKDVEDFFMKMFTNMGCVPYGD